LIGQLDFMKGLPFGWGDDVNARFAVVFGEGPPLAALGALKDRGVEVYVESEHGFRRLL
jgi:hypothetical protein